MNIKELIGKTLKEAKQSGDEIIFVTEDNQSYKMYHQDD